MICAHSDVEIIEATPLTGETYGDLYGQCRSCLCCVKAYGMIEDNPNHLEPRGEWEIDVDAMQDVMP